MDPKKYRWPEGMFMPNTHVKTALTSEIIGDRIVELARSSYAGLAEQYARETAKVKAGEPRSDETRAAQDMIDLIDDIACIRFGMGFYTP